MQSRNSFLFFSVVTLITAALLLAGCGGGKATVSGSLPMGTVNTSISDPPTCSSASGGPYQHVYVTVRSVMVHQSATANANAGGWQELAPGLANAPKQIDLLGNPSNQCFLAQLGAQQIPAGSYQQIRIILLANNQASQLTTNACGANATNCVVLNPSGSVQPLQLSSESNTGIKIPSGQIAGGRFTVPDGGVVDLNVDFDACASIVAQPNGQFRLKPVLHAGEVSLQTNIISGKVVDSATSQPITGTTIVALEQRDAATGVDRVIMQTLADAQGNFSFCPVPEGTYDVVAVSISDTGLAYAATVTTGVAVGTNMGNIPMVAQTGANTTQGSITGQVSTAGASGGVAADITLSATQPLTIGGSSTLVTIPLVQQSSSTATLTTASDAACPAGTFCASYTVSVPAANPNVGAFSAGGTTYTQDTANPVNYTMDALAFVPLSGSTPDCSPSDVQVNTLQGGGALAVTAGSSVTAATIAFTGCS